MGSLSLFGLCRWVRDLLFHTEGTGAGTGGVCSALAVLLRVRLCTAPAQLKDGDHLPLRVTCPPGHLGFP